MWNLKVSAYCLAPNHYYLLDTPDGNISPCMRHINGAYTQRFNLCHKKDGQLFRDRYKEVLVEADNHLLEVLRYIHQNPLSTVIAKELDKFTWNSHGAYVSNGKKWGWLYKDFLLSMFARKKNLARRAYVEFVSQISLRLELEPRGYSTDDLDEAFGSRDDEWQLKELITERFKKTIHVIKKILDSDTSDIILRSRFKNQADFYTLFGTIDSMAQETILPDNSLISERLISFINYELTETSEQDIKDYYEYVRAASNRTLARKERERILKRILIGDIVL